MSVVYHDCDSLLLLKSRLEDGVALARPCNNSYEFLHSDDGDNYSDIAESYHLGSDAHGDVSLLLSLGSCKKTGLGNVLLIADLMQQGHI